VFAGAVAGSLSGSLTEEMKRHEYTLGARCQRGAAMNHADTNTAAGADTRRRRTATHEARGAETFAVIRRWPRRRSPTWSRQCFPVEFRWKSLSSPCAPPNLPEVALIRSPSVDARSIVSAGGEPRQKFRRRKVSSTSTSCRSQPIAALASPTTGSPDKKWLLQCRGRSASTPLYDPENSCRWLSLECPGGPAVSQCCVGSG
jgi:hypothetical protein